MTASQLPPTAVSRKLPTASASISTVYATTARNDLVTFDARTRAIRSQQRITGLAAGLFFITYYVNIDRGFSYLWVFFVLLVVIMDFALRRTRWGRHRYRVPSIGGVSVTPISV